MGLERLLHGGTDFERILRKAGYEPVERLDNADSPDDLTGVFLTKSPHTTELVVATIGQQGNVTIASRDRLLPFTHGEDALRTIPRLYSIDAVTDKDITYVISPMQYLPPEKHKHMLDVVHVDRKEFVKSMITICEDQERLYRKGLIIEDRAIQNYRVEEGFRNPLNVDRVCTLKPGEGGARGTPGFVPPHLSPSRLEGTVTELTYSTAQVILKAADFHGLNGLEEVKLVREYVERYHRAPQDSELWIGDLRELLERPAIERAQRKAARRSMVRGAGVSLILLLAAALATNNVLNNMKARAENEAYNRAVYALSENAPLDEFAKIDLQTNPQDTSAVHALERKLGVALGRKIAQLYTPVAAGGVLSKPFTDSTRNVPAVMAKDEVFGIGAPIHLPEGNAFTEIVCAAAGSDRRALSSAEALTRSQLYSLSQNKALKLGLWNNMAVGGLECGYELTNDPKFLVGIVKAGAFAASLAERSRAATSKDFPVLPSHRWTFKPFVDPFLQHFDMYFIAETLIHAHDAQALLRSHPEAARTLYTDTAFQRVLSGDSLSTEIRPAPVDPLGYDYLKLARELMVQTYPALFDGTYVYDRADWNGHGWTRSKNSRSIGQALFAYASWEVAKRSSGEIAYRLREQSMKAEDVLLSYEGLPPQFLKGDGLGQKDAAAAALAYRVAREQGRPVGEYWPVLSGLVKSVPRAVISRRNNSSRDEIHRPESYIMSGACALSNLSLCGVSTTTSASDFLAGLLY